MEGNNMADKENINNIIENMRACEQEIAKAIIGQEDVVHEIILAILADGNVLLEGVPGLGKTQLVKTISKVLDLSFSRIQFTPDLMPADVTGTNLIIKEGGNNVFKFEQGPVFANIVLADEINRATPKTQAAMLEAMQERQTTIGGTVYKMPDIFMVIATQNPIEQEGTYLLAEAQLDRFLLKEKLDYPTMEEELEVLNRIEKDIFINNKSVLDIKDITYLQKLAKKVYLDESIKKYIVNIINATRNVEEVVSKELAKYVTMGASTRGAIAFMEASKALALIRGRNYVIPKDIKALKYTVLRHRIELNFAAIADNVSVEKIIDEIIGAIKTP